MRFVLVYTTALPLALWSRIGWLTVFVAPLVAFLLIGIENIGNQIENPLLVPFGLQFWVSSLSRPLPR